MIKRIIFIATLMVALQAQAAVDIFLDAGDIKGESTDQQHKDKIEVLSWSWSMFNSKNLHDANGATKSSPAFSDISIAKMVDRSSPGLMLKCARGEIIPKVQLILRQSGENPLEFMRIKMEDVIVSSVNVSASANGDRPFEEVTLHFQRINVEYTPQKMDGSGDTAVIFNFDIPLNK